MQLVDAGQPRFVKGFSKRALRVINRAMRLKEQPPFPSADGADELAATVPSGGSQGLGRDMRPSGGAAPAAEGVGGGQEMLTSGSSSRLPVMDPDRADSLAGSSTGGSAIPRSDGPSLKSFSGSASDGSSRSVPTTDSAGSDVAGGGSDSDESTASKAALRVRQARARRRRPPTAAALRRVPAAAVPQDTAPRVPKRPRRS